MAFTKLFVLTLVIAINLQEISGHGMMWDPVNRSSAWRKGFPVEPNYTDNEHFCGGYGVCRRLQKIIYQLSILKKINKYFLRFNTKKMVASAENVATIILYLDHGQMKMVASMDPVSLFKSE